MQLIPILFLKANQKEIIYYKVVRLNNTEILILYKQVLEESNFSESSQERYFQCAKKILNNCNIEDENSIKDYMYQKVLKDNIPMYRAVLKHLLKATWKDSKRLKNLFERIPKPRNDKLSKFNRINLEPAQISKLISHLSNYKHQLMAEIMFSTGLRWNDLSGLEYDNLILEEYKEGRSLRLKILGKGSKENKVYITNPKLIDKILDYKINYPFGSKYIFLQIDFDLIKRKTKFQDRRILNDLSKNEKRFIKLEKENDIISGDVGSLIDLNESGISSDVFEREFQELFKTNKIKWFNKFDTTITNTWKVKRLNYKYFLNDLKQAMQQIGMSKDSFSVHDFRRCFGVQIYNKTNKDIQALRKALNHSRIETSLLYIKNAGFERKELDNLIQSDFQII